MKGTGAVGLANGLSLLQIMQIYTIFCSFYALFRRRHEGGSRNFTVFTVNKLQAHI
jgi:hypothetical protein